MYLEKNQKYLVRSKIILSNYDKSKHSKINNFLESKIGEVIHKKGYFVSMKNYDVVFKVYLLNDIIIFCVLLSCVNRSLFQIRKPDKKPFFSPGVIIPQLARFICNIARIKEKSIVLDPFCGTCGLLIESLYLGSYSIGIDVQEKILNGAKKNIEYYNNINIWSNNYDLLFCNAKNLPFPNNFFDSIVTDLPYGHSTIIEGNSKEELFLHSFLEMYRVLKFDCYAVIVYSKIISNLLSNVKFKIIKIYTQRVHKSLTRYIHLVQKK